jgi:pilus assembly protein CpaE
VVNEEHLARILSLLRISYSHLILDLSKSLTPIDLAGLRHSDHVLLVGQLELASLRNVVRLLLALSQEAELADRVRVVMNRVGSDYAEGDISLKKAEETIGKPIFWQVPNDSKAVRQARVDGLAWIQAAPKCRAQQSVLALAQALNGKAVSAPPPAANAGGSGLFRRLIGR